MTNSSASRPVRASDMGRRAGVLALCVCLFLTPLPVAAQTDDDEDRRVPVLIVDMQRIKSETSAGRDMRSKTIEIRRRIQAGIAARSESLRAEERRLAEERESLDPEDFRRQVVSFEQQVFANREFSEQESRRLQGLLSRASALLREQATAVLAEIMRERKAEVMLDSTQIVLSVDRLDITDEAIRMLDRVLPEIPLDIGDPPLKN